MLLSREGTRTKRRRPTVLVSSVPFLMSSYSFVRPNPAALQASLIVQVGRCMNGISTKEARARLTLTGRGSAETARSNKSGVSSIIDASRRLQIRENLAWTSTNTNNTCARYSRLFFPLSIVVLASRTTQEQQIHPLPQARRFVPAPRSSQAFAGPARRAVNAPPAEGRGLGPRGLDRSPRPGSLWKRKRKALETDTQIAAAPELP
jgi:hypothetical protein